MRRAPRLGLVELVLYNWRKEATPTALEDAVTEEAEDVATEGVITQGDGAVGDGVHPPASDGAKSNAPQRLHACAPLSVFSRPGHASMARVSPMLRFLCVEEEAWFCRLHVALAGEASLQMAAIRKCFDARSVEQQVRGLQQLEGALEVLVRVHYTAGIGQPIGQASPKVKPALLMHRMHRFLPFEPEMGLDAAEQRAARIYCATGIDQSCLLHLMGVAKGHHALQTFREWQQSEAAAELPCSHREYLQACLARPSIRDAVERAVGLRNLSVNDLSRLELAYNSCIDMMLRYFARRNELMRAMFGADTLKEAFDLERSGILAARVKLLVERRESFRRSDNTLTASPSALALAAEHDPHVVMTSAPSVAPATAPPWSVE